MTIPFRALLVNGCLTIFCYSAYINADEPASGNGIAFTNANIVTMQTADTVFGATLLVKGGKIEAIAPASTPIDDSYRIVDLNNQWVVPGFIDGHVHLNQSGSAYSRPDIIDATAIEPYAVEQAWLRHSLPDITHSYIMNGVTTIVDMGGPSAWIPDYDELSKNPSSPYILRAAELISAAPVPALNADGPVFKTVKDATAATDEVKRQLLLPSQVVKFVWTHEAGLSPEALMDRYTQAMKTARDAGKIVAVHAESLPYAKAAIKAGAHILVHGVITDYIDDEFIALAQKHNVSYMPTLTAHQHYKSLFLRNIDFTERERAIAPKRVQQSFKALLNAPAKDVPMYAMMSKYMTYVDDTASIGTLSVQEQGIVGQLSAMFSERIRDIQFTNLKRAADARLRLAFGTDAGNPGTLHGVSIHEEMRAWLKAGISPDTLLHAMTVGTAEAMKINNITGALLSSKEASFIVFPTSPLSEELSDLSPSYVVKSGQIVYSPSSESHYAP